MSDLILAVALVLAIEGAIYGAAPAQMKAMMRRMQDIPNSTLRASGLGALAVGVLIVWMIRG